MRLLPLFVYFAFLASCTKMMHVYQTEPSRSTTNQAFSFDNDTVRVDYNFWSENGQVTFSIYNKMNIPLYLDWRKSSFILNKTKHNYWDDVAKTKSAKRASRAPISNELIIVGESQTSRDEQISFIPPYSRIKRSQYSLKPGTDMIYQTRKKADKDPRVISIDRKFDEEASPIAFRIFMTLSTSNNFTKEFYIDNGYYVSKILELKEKEFLGSNPKIPGSKVQKSLFESPSAFYNYAAAH